MGNPDVLNIASRFKPLDRICQIMGSYDNNNSYINHTVEIQPAAIAGTRTWIVSCEDLILSKLVWALESNSELQRRDIHQLLAEAVDLDYIRNWAPQLGVAKLLNELMP